MRPSTEPTREEIERVVSGLRVRKHAPGNEVNADCPCPGCPNPVGHLYMSRDTGQWMCHRCQESGSLWSLATHMGLRLRERSLVRAAGSVLLTSPQAEKHIPSIPMAKVDSAHASLFSDNQDGKAVLDYLHSRGFDDETIKRFKLGVVHIREGKSEPAVGIPYFHNGKPTLIKMRNLATSKDDRKFRRYPTGAASILFNADAVKGRSQVVAVEGEMDAMSVYQLGFPSVCSTSLGAKKDLPQEWMDALADADDIVLWYDEDEVGQDSVAHLVERLGSHRCRVAHIPDSLAEIVEKQTGSRPKDANDLLKAGVEADSVKWIIDHATGIKNTAVVEVGAFGDQIYSEVMRGEEALGVSTGWSSLDNLLKGWRTRELTVVTGHTSHGKSTWATEAHERICKLHNEPILMSALENGPVTAVRKMVQRVYGMPLSSARTDADRARVLAAITEVSKLPAYVLDLYGRQRFDAIAEALLYARKRLGVKYAMLDHLHFLAKENDRQDDREFLDNLAMKLVSLTREIDIHLMLLCHPRGSVELSTLPGGDSIKGTSTIKQVADNGITIYRSTDALGDAKAREVNLRDGGGKRVKVHMGQCSSLVYVWKARHDDAREGACILEFEPRSLTFKTDRSASERPQEVNNNESSSDPFMSAMA